MAKHKRKNYYAVIRGKCYPAPGIFSSWGVASALVDRCTGNIFKGFQTFEEAVAYMEQGDVHSYGVFVKKPADEKEPFAGDKYYYAVANGREEGIYEYYYNGAEPQVIRYPSQCHKRFRTEKEAREFIDEWKRTSAQVLDEEVENIGIEDMISGMTISEEE